MRIRTTFLAIVAASALVFSIPGVFAAPSSVVVPNALATVEGNLNNSFPFNLGNAGVTSQRYQQVFAAGEFSGGSGRITQIAFRPDALFGTVFSTTLANVQINLSTTSKAPDGLDTTFANNVGSDDTVVHSGALALSSSFTGPAGGPKAFDIVIPLQTPFVYDPGKGNLLLDVRNFSGEISTVFDAEDTLGDPVSRLTSNAVTDLTGGAGTLGLVTEFAITPSTCHSPHQHNCGPH